jgi:tetratricopeptide (TPR) repeat protein
VTEPVRTQDILRNVTLQRRKGDALARAGRVDAAKQAYELAVSLLDGALEGIPISGVEQDSPSTGPNVSMAADAADMFGIKGGLLRRMGRLAGALESYRRGAEIEYGHDLPATYNRVNAIKLALIMGASSINDLRDDMQRLRAALEGRLSTDERVADDAWAWADLGDVRLLLGDDLEAASAYRTFAAKARTDSPTTTLSVLRQLVSALEAHGDQDAARIMASLSRVEGLLGPARPQG